MDIVILADFCGRFNGVGNNRFLYLANILSEKHSVEILTSNFNHGTKAHFEKTPEHLPYKVTMLNEPNYKKNICLKRFYAHFLWGKNVKEYLSKRKKPDVVYCAVPTLKAAYEAAKYCEKNNIKFIIDIQDLWPEAFKMVFRIPVLSDLIFAPFTWLANAIYKRADEVVAVSDTYVERALSVNQKCMSGHTVYLGTKLETFDSYVENNPVNKPDDELWLGYCGTLGASYDITCVLDALVLLKDRGVVPPKFLVMGDGPRKTEFEKYANRKNIDAVFTGRLPYDQMCGRLACCDIVVNPITRGAAQSIINKHADYAASGLPVLNTQECEEYRNLVSHYAMGYNCVNNNANDMAEKLEKLIRDEALRVEMGKNARRCAEERFDRKNSYGEIIDCIVGK